MPGQKHKLARTKKPVQTEAVSCNKDHVSEDKFTALVNNLTSGNLSFNQLQIAYRASIREDRFAEGFKDLLAGGANGAGPLFKLFQGIGEVRGTVELAYRRGLDVGEIRGLEKRDRKYKKKIKELNAKIKELESFME